MKTNGDVASELMQTMFFKGMKHHNAPSHHWIKDGKIVEHAEVEKFIFIHLQGSGQDSVRFVNDVIKILKLLTV